MSDNRKALIRYLAYDRCLSNPGRRFGYTDLIEEANAALATEGLEGIGKSQFYKDIEFLQVSEYQAPIEKYRDGGAKVYYRYSDPDYSIRKKPISKSELDTIKSAISVLTRFRGLPQFEWIYEVIPTLEDKLGVVSKEREIISFDSNVDYSGNHWLPELFHAAINQQCLHIGYKPFHSEDVIEFDMHPHYLKQYNGRWFLFGLHEQLNVPTWNSPLDRIVSIAHSEIPFKETEVDWFEYFDDMIGVTRKEGQVPEEIKLWARLEHGQCVARKRNPKLWMAREVGHEV